MRSICRANYEIQSTAAARRLHALNLLTALAKTESSTVPWGKPALQRTFVDWLDTLACGASRPGDFETRQAVSLLVKVSVLTTLDLI